MNTGSISISVTNAVGMSNSVAATMQTFLPGLFTQSGYVIAVRPSDATIINGTGAAVSGYTTAASAKPGDILEIFGTLTVMIGGQPATVLWAGLVEAGLWQINVEVPTTLSGSKFSNRTDAERRGVLI